MRKILLSSFWLVLALLAVGCARKPASLPKDCAFTIHAGAAAASKSFLRESDLSGKEAWASKDALFTPSNGVTVSLKSMEATRRFVFGFEDEDSRKLRALTTKHLNKTLCVKLRGRLLSCPVVRSPISTMMVIEGTFTAQEAKDLLGTCGI